MGPRKVRLICDELKKLTPREALERLKFYNKRISQPLMKTIKQAMANATGNFKLKEENLKFNKIEVQSAQIMKRWQPVSRGRAHPIKKRTCHIKVILEGGIK